MKRWYRSIRILLFLFLTLSAALGSLTAEPRRLEKEVRVAGILDPTGTAHYYQICAEAGEVVWIETFAQRLTPPSPLDTVLSLLSGDQKRVLAVSDDIETALEKDSLIAFAVPASGPYVIKLESFESFMGLDAAGGRDLRYEIQWTTAADSRFLYFPQIIDGVVFTTTLLLANHATHSASGSINLMNSDGSALVTKLDEQLTSSLRFMIPPRGTLRVETQPFGGLRAGWALILSDAPLSGSALFQARVADTILSEASVQAAPRTRAFTSFTQSTGTSSTGLAIANPGPGPASIHLTLRNQQGEVLSSATKILLAHEHRAFFTDELFSQVPGVDTLEGTIEAVSSSDVVAVTLRFDAEDLVFTTLPVLFGQATHRIFFPHIADGAGWRTTFILMNNSEAEARGTLRLFRSDGTPFELRLANGPAGNRFGEEVIRIPARGTLRLESSGTGSELRTGWAEVAADAPISGHAIFQALEGRKVLSEAGVSVLRPVRYFILFVDTLGFAKTGLAVANVSEHPAELILKLLNRMGEEVSSVALRLAPYAHTARFIHELFRHFSGIEEFEGSILVHSDTDLSPVTLRLDNQRSNVFTSMPVIVP